MYRCDFSFAHIQFQFESEFEIRVGKELLPFLIEGNKKNLVADCVVKIEFILQKELPKVVKVDSWREDKLYTSIEEDSVVFIRNSMTQPPNIMIRYCKKKIEINYLPEAENYLKYTHDILNLLGLEKILLDHSAFLLHSSLIRYQENGIIFSAPCGVGKSTQANLWEKYKDSETLNGDRAGIRFVNQKWMAYGMPFAGTSGIYINDSVPVTAIVILEQNKVNQIRKLTPMEAIRKLLPECSCRRWDGEFMNQLFDLLIGLIQKVPVYLLQCRPDEEAVEFLYKTLVKEEFL